MVLVLASFELLFFFPRFYLQEFLFVLAALVVGVWRVNSQPAFEKLRALIFWNFLIPVIFFYGTAFFWTLFLPSKIYAHLMGLFTAFFVFIYFRYLKMYFRAPIFYDEKTLINLSLFFGIFSLFFIYSTLMSAVLLLNFPLVLASLIYATVVLLVVYEYLWIVGVESIKSFIYGLVVAFAFLQFFWSLNFLPVDFFTLTFVMTIFFFVIIKIITFRFQEDDFSFQRIRKYIIIGLLMILLVFLTTRWR